MSVGTVQFFCKHQVSLTRCDGMKEKVDHVFAYVEWKVKHSNESWYGLTAVVCCNFNESSSIFSFIPVQRIHSVCIYSVLDVNMTDTTDETVFIAVPISMKYCL